jgi:hypothetical protein
VKCANGICRKAQSGRTRKPPFVRPRHRRGGRPKRALRRQARLGSRRSRLPSEARPGSGTETLCMSGFLAMMRRLPRRSVPHRGRGLRPNGWCRRTRPTPPQPTGACRLHGAEPFRRLRSLPARESSRSTPNPPARPGSLGGRTASSRRDEAPLPAVAGRRRRAGRRRPPQRGRSHRRRATPGGPPLPVPPPPRRFGESPARSSESDPQDPESDLPYPESSSPIHESDYRKSR